MSTYRIVLLFPLSYLNRLNISLEVLHKVDLSRKWCNSGSVRDVILRRQLHPLHLSEKERTPGKEGRKKDKGPFVSIEAYRGGHEMWNNESN